MKMKGKEFTDFDIRFNSMVCNIYHFVVVYKDVLVTMPNGFIQYFQKFKVKYYHN